MSGPDQLPLISIITPCLNRKNFIAEAVESVLTQKYPYLEHIILDGGSTDGTLEILKHYSHLKVVSEPDQGMYDALNKGINHASGEVIGLLNSDDLYEPGIFEQVGIAFQQDSDLVVLSGGAITFRNSAGHRQIISQSPWLDEKNMWYRLAQGKPSMNACFFRRCVFDRIGLFDVSFRYAADREFMVRIPLANIAIISLHRYVYAYQQHAESYTISAQDSRQPQRGAQRMRVLEEALVIPERYLNQVQVPPQARRYLRRSHMELTYRLSATALYHHRWSLAFETARRGWRVTPWWPLSFLRLAVRRLLLGAHWVVYPDID